jgi:hypothetical protein
MTWTIFFTILATASVTQIAVILKDHALARREGRFSALYAALFFESYAKTCSKALSESELSLSTDGNAGSFEGFPSLPEFPKEINWRKIGMPLTERAFALRVEAEFWNGVIADAAEFDFPDGGIHEAMLGCTEFGLKALELAERLRDSKWLPPPVHPNKEYTVQRHLTERRADQLEKRRKRIEYEKSLPNDFASLP